MVVCTHLFGEHFGLVRREKRKTDFLKNILNKIIVGCKIENREDSSPKINTQHVLRPPYIYRFPPDIIVPTNLV